MATRGRSADMGASLRAASSVTQSGSYPCAVTDRSPVDPRTPVLVGAGQFLQRADGVDGAMDATAMMAEAVRAAAADAGLSGVPQPESTRVVGLLSWRYGDPG